MHERFMNSPANSSVVSGNKPEPLPEYYYQNRGAKGTIGGRKYARQPPDFRLFNEDIAEDVDPFTGRT
jgi:hypothetical protein